MSVVECGWFSAVSANEWVRIARGKKLLVVGFGLVLCVEVACTHLAATLQSFLTPMFVKLERSFLLEEGSG